MRKFSVPLHVMVARMYVLVLVLLMVCVGSSLVCKQVACWQVARMRWQVTCVGSSLGSLAADAHVGGGRVLSLRRGALAARREDEESSLGCLVSAPLVFVG